MDELKFCLQVIIHRFVSLLQTFTIAMQLFEFEEHFLLFNLSGGVAPVELLYRMSDRLVLYHLLQFIDCTE